jgi:hypothetical protein
VGRARILGVEASAAAEWARALRVEGTVTAMDPRDTTTGLAMNATANDVLPLTSRLTASGRFEVFTSHGLRALREDRASLAVLYSYRSSRFADPAGQIVLPEQHTVDIEATTAHLGGALVARFAVRNVLGARQLDLIGLPLPGRSVHAGLEAWW